MSHNSVKTKPINRKIEESSSTVCIGKNPNIKIDANPHKETWFSRGTESADRWKGGIAIGHLLYGVDLRNVLGTY